LLSPDPRFGVDHLDALTGSVAWINCGLVSESMRGFLAAAPRPRKVGIRPHLAGFASLTWRLGEKLRAIPGDEPRCRAPLETRPRGRRAVPPGRRACAERLGDQGSWARRTRSPQISSLSATRTMPPRAVYGVMPNELCRIANEPRIRNSPAVLVGSTTL